MSTNTIEVPGVTLHTLVQKWNEELSGGYVQQLRAVHEDTFVLKIHTKQNTIQLIIALPHLLIESARKWENAEEQPPIVNATKKMLDNLRIVHVEQLGMDRILVLRGDSANIIVELFGEGNLIITNEKDIIQFVHRAKEWKGRTLKMREKYVAPQNERKNKHPLEEMLGKKIHGYTLTAEKNRLQLLPVFEKNSKAVPIQTIFSEMEEKIIEEWKKPLVDSKLESQKQALRVNAERQKELLKEWEKKIEAKQKEGEWVYANFQEVQLLLDAVQRGLKQKIPERKIVDEIKKKMPYVTRIDAENGTVELDIHEK